MYEVLYAAAWIVGEFSKWVYQWWLCTEFSDTNSTWFSSELNEPETTLNILLKHRTLPGHIQGVYVQNILKLFSRVATALLEKNDPKRIAQLCNLLLKKLPTFISSGHIEVQERASSAYVLIEMLREQFGAIGNPDTVVPQTDDILSDIPVNEVAVTEDANEIPSLAIDIIREMAILFAGDLNPVAPKAQRKVQLPDGLDLDVWINPPPAESSSSSEDEQTDLFVANDHVEHEKSRTTIELTEEERDQMREARRIEQSHNPNYLKSSNKKVPHKPRKPHRDDCEDIPIAELDIDVALQITCKWFWTKMFSLAIAHAKRH